MQKHFCIKKGYTKQEAEEEVSQLAFFHSEHPWEVRYCSFCEEWHVWKNFAVEYGRLSWQGPINA